MNKLEKPRTNRAGNFDFQGQDHGTAATRKGHFSDLYEKSWSQRGERKADRHNKQYDVTSGIDEYNVNESTENQDEHVANNARVESSEYEEYATHESTTDEWDNVSESDYLDALYEKVSHLLKERNNLPRTADGDTWTQTQLDAQKDELDAEMDSLKDRIEDIEGHSALPTDETVGLWTKKRKEDYLRKEHSMHGDNEDDLGLDTVDDSIRAYKIPKH